MMPGDTIAGKYRLIRPVGKGSMGEVWAALHVEMRRTVALKLIYEGSEALAVRLKREALACGRLEHPNIVRIYDIGETTAGDPFLVMELLQGETLAERMARPPRLTPAEALSITLQIARALRAAHGAGVVHRDLKPANVHLHRGPDAETDQVKVLDFGVSKLLSLGDTALTVTGALVGSPAYMSPEAARAVREIDARADLWSLGVLLFEMLGGARPFAGVTVFGVVAEILSGPIPTLASVLPGVDPRLDEAVGRCLTRELSERMPSAAALIEALVPVLASVSVTGSVLAAPRAPLPAPASSSDEQETVELDRSTFRLPGGRGPPGAAPEQDEEATLAWRSAEGEPEPEKTTTEMQGAHALAFRRELAAGIGARDPALDTALLTGARAPALAAPRDAWGVSASEPARRPPDPWSDHGVREAGRVTRPPDSERMPPQASHVPLITALSVVALLLLAIIAVSLLSQTSEPPAAPRPTPSAGRDRQLNR